MTTLTRTVENARIVIEFDGPPPACDIVARAVAEALASVPDTPPPSADTEEPTLIGLLAIAGKADGLPADYAAQHDHYIHGTPKR